ncbi:hypothetical protein Tco_0503962 [Tanacetum coccineum]
MEQENIQQAALDQVLVPTDDQVMIGSSNMRIDPSNTQKEATYQVILDILKLSPCYNAFLITADVFEIYWFTVTKIKKSSFYHFQLNDQKFKVDVELFWKILCICPRVPNKEFIKPHPYDSLVTFLKQLGYKGSLDLISDMLKFISKRELTQVYGMYIPNEMMNDEIKNSVAYQTYLALSTGIKPPKKGIGKGKGLMSKQAATPALEKKKSVLKKRVPITAEENILFDSDEALYNLAQERLNLNKGTPKRREDYILQQIPKGSSEGSGSKLEVSDEPKGKSICSSEGAGITPKVPDELNCKSIAQDDGWDLMKKK